MDIFSGLNQFFTDERIGSLIRVAVLIIVGLPLILFFSRFIKKTIAKRHTPQKGMIASKIFYYSCVIIILFSVLNEFGFKLTHLLGAAGIVGIAIGFAAQTSISNIISGFFLMTEQPFVVNDVISVGDVVGQVLSIDILSIKMRTFDNKLVRIPNESILKGQVTNITHFPIRRVDIEIGVAYKEDLTNVQEVLLDIAHKNPLCLQEPEPLFIFSGFGSSSIDLKFAVWAVKTDWLAVKNSMLQEIKKRFDEEGIEIPFPHTTLYTGSVTEPFPIQLFGGKDDNLFPKAKRN